MRRCTVLVCVTLLAMVPTACGQRTPEATSGSASQSGMPLAGEFGGRDPGSLISANNLPTVDRRLSGVSSVAARIRYLSTSGIDGSRQEVTGTVFAPKGTPPEGGWPMIAYGHPTSGIQPECAPSLDPMLLGMSEPIAGLVKAGYVVAVSDYQGLGNDGTYHPYLDSTTAGYNLVDAVRAARKLVPNTSNRWGAFGGSQGGQAAWAANELAAGYAAELELVGTASYSAPLSIAGLVDAAMDGSLTSEQRFVLLQVLASLAKESPDFQLDDYRRGAAKQNWDVLLACTGPDVAKRDEIANEITADDVRPISDQAADMLRSRLQQMSLPRTPATAPILIVYGGQDELVRPVWTNEALNEACRMGDVIQIELQVDRGHAQVDGSLAFPWILQRFAGDAPRNDCPALIEPVEEIAPAEPSEPVETAEPAEAIEPPQEP